MRGTVESVDNPYVEEYLIDLAVDNDCFIDVVSASETIADQLYYIAQDGLQQQ